MSQGVHKRLWVILLLVALVATPMSAYAAPFAVKGNGRAFKVSDNRLTLPDCTITSAHAHWTMWDVNESYNTQDGYQFFFEILAKAKVKEYAPAGNHELAAYDYGGLELHLTSQEDPSLTARMRLRPAEIENFPEIGAIVDVHLAIYKDEGKAGEEASHHDMRLESADLWNRVMHLTLEYYELKELSGTKRIEYHTLQNDPDAPATPSANPPILRDGADMQKIVGLLQAGERMERRMAASDVLHLRLVLGDGKVCNVYLQDVLRMGGAKVDDPGTMYARMGGYCYRVDREALLDALKDAGCPDPMLRAR